MGSCIEALPVNGAMEGCGLFPSGGVGASFGFGSGKGLHAPGTGSGLYPPGFTGRGQKGGMGPMMGALLAQQGAEAASGLRKKIFGFGGPGSGRKPAKKGKKKAAPKKK